MDNQKDTAVDNHDAPDNTGRNLAAVGPAPAPVEEPSVEEPSREHKNSRGVVTGVAGVVAALLAIGMASAGLLVASRPIPLANTNPSLYSQLLVAEKTLADANTTVTSRISCVTVGTAPDGSVCIGMAAPDDSKPWTKVLLPTTDTSVGVAQNAALEAVTLHGWVELYKNQATKVTSKTPTAASPDFAAAAPAPGMAYLITSQQGEDLLAAVKAGQTGLDDALAGVDEALGAAQKAAAMDAYTTAITTLETALNDAGNLLSSTQGKVSDNSTRQGLQDAITAAQATHDTTSGISVDDAKTATDVQTAIDALTGAAGSLEQPSQAVKDSNQAWQAQQAAEAAKKKTQAPKPSTSGGGSSTPSTSGGGGGTAPSQPSAPQRPTITVLRRFDAGADIGIAYQVYDPSRVGWTVTATCGSESESNSGVGNIQGGHSMGKDIPGCSVDTINVTIS